MEDVTFTVQFKQHYQRVRGSQGKGVLNIVNASIGEREKKVVGRA